MLQIIHSGLTRKVIYLGSKCKNDNGVTFTHSSVLVVSDYFSNYCHVASFVTAPCSLVIVDRLLSSLVTSCHIKLTLRHG